MKQWQIVVHNDEVNAYPVVVHILNRVVGLSCDTAREATRRIHQKGFAGISSTSQHAAELMVARLRGYGLDASVAWSQS